MALTQSARLPGPSWDEEVVPALRKRLQSESRTLSRRLSAISLSSADEPSSLNYSGFSERTVRQQIPPLPTSSQQSFSSGGQMLQSPYQPQYSSDRPMPTAIAPVNGTSNSSTSAVPSNFQRARTYSYASDGRANGNARPKVNATKPADPTRSLSPRPVDVKPTRIPKRPSPGMSSNAATSPYTNGYGHITAVTPPSQSTELPYQSLPAEQGPQRGLVHPSSTLSSVDLPTRGNWQTPGLLNESPPFPADATMSSGFSQQPEEDPPRPSVESEERPFEHWYRGEVSRNGGVGELRVGRRQEMLDIANYGHSMGNKKVSPSRALPMNVVDDVRRHRKRADSIAGITNKERGSLYLDDEHANEVGRVLDEGPLTDIEGEGSDINSASDHYNAVRGEAYAYLPEAGDISSTPSEQWTSTAGAHETRSTTPTPSMMQRPSSRQQQNLPPTRIPGPSARGSSESRSTVTTPISMIRGASEPPQAYSSSSKTPSPPPAPSSSNSRQQAYGNNTFPTSAQKRGVSPASKKSRTTASQATRARTEAAKREKDKNRTSVAYYPTPAGGEGDDMADAIPSWTQPIHREGNWDEVVLPVVARKKGLNGYYEDADGSPRPKKIENPIEPAPGTFGFDHSKYRPPRNNDEFIPMDEFGRQPEQRTDEDADRRPVNGLPMMNDDVPVRIPPSPSPAPFSHYAPSSVHIRVNQPGTNVPQMQDQQLVDDDKHAGCCKCVVM